MCCIPSLSFYFQFDKLLNISIQNITLIHMKATVDIRKVLKFTLALT